MARKFFSGATLEQAVLGAARHYGIEPEKVAFHEREKKHGFLNIRRKFVIEVDPNEPTLPEGVVVPWQPKLAGVDSSLAPAADPTPPAASVATPMEASPPPVQQLESGAVGRANDGHASWSGGATIADEEPSGTDGGRQGEVGDEAGVDAARVDAARVGRSPFGRDRPGLGNPDQRRADQTGGEVGGDGETLGAGGEERGREERSQEGRGREGRGRRPARGRGGRGQGGRRERGSSRRGPEGGRSRSNDADEGSYEWITAAAVGAEIPEMDDPLDATDDALGEIADFLLYDMQWDIRQEVDESIVVELSGEDSDRIVAGDAEVMRAVEHLLPRLVRSRFGETAQVTVDCDGFQGRHEKEIETMAAEVAAVVRGSREAQLLEPMTPADRRLVHVALADDPSVTTESEGYGFSKRVRVSPA